MDLVLCNEVRVAFWGLAHTRNQLVFTLLQLFKGTAYLWTTSPPTEPFCHRILVCGLCGVEVCGKDAWDCFQVFTLLIVSEFCGALPSTQSWLRICVDMCPVQRWKTKPNTVINHRANGQTKVSLHYLVTSGRTAVSCMEWCPQLIVKWPKDWVLHIWPPPSKIKMLSEGCGGRAGCERHRVTGW